MWSDAYYLGANLFAPGSLTFAGAAAVALDRTKMVAGDQTATAILFDLATFAPDADAILPVSQDGFVLPPPSTPGLFAEFNADEFGSGQQDTLTLFEFRPNFANPAGSTFARRPDLPLQAFGPGSPLGRVDIEQPGAAVNQSLDAISGRLMHRLAYRNLGTSGAPINSYVLNFPRRRRSASPTWRRRTPSTASSTRWPGGTSPPGARPASTARAIP